MGGTVEKQQIVNEAYNLFLEKLAAWENQQQS
jgi:hypothetical protein